MTRMIIGIILFFGAVTGSARECRAILGARVNGKSCYCAALKSNINPDTQGNECEKKEFEALTSVLHDVQREPTCKNQDRSGLCPQAIKGAVLQDDHFSLMGLAFSVKNAEQNCRHTINPQAQKLTPEQLEDQLGKSETYSLGNPAPLHVLNQACLPKGLPLNLLFPADKVTEDQRKAVVAEYYYTANRLNQGELLGIESVGAIDSILGTPLLEGAQCDSPGNPHARLKCDQIRNSNCRPASNQERETRLNDMVSRTRQALQLREELNLKKRVSNVAALTGRKDLLQKDLIPSIVELEKNIGNLAPWIKGDAFNRIVKSNIDNPAAIKNGIIEQLKENRKAILQQQGAIVEARNCISSSNQLHCTQIGELFNKIPELATDSSQPLLTDHINNAICRVNTRPSIQVADSADFQLAIAALTWGAGSLAATLGKTGEVIFDFAAVRATTVPPAVAKIRETCKESIGKLVNSNTSMSCEQGYTGPNVISDYQACYLGGAAEVASAAVGALSGVAMRRVVVPGIGLAWSRAKALKNFSGFKRFESLAGRQGTKDTLLLGEEASEEARERLQSFAAQTQTKQEADGLAALARQRRNCGVK